MSGKELYREKINDLEFVLESTDATRIEVYQEGSIDPVYLIKVDPNLSKKDFDYEIMDYVVKAVG